jgi:hypothetical protein
MSAASLEEIYGAPGWHGTPVENHLFEFCLSITSSVFVVLHDWKT